MADWKQSSAKETSRLKQTVGNIFGLGGPKVGLLADEDSGERSVETSRFFTEDVLKVWYSHRYSNPYGTVEPL